MINNIKYKTPIPIRAQYGRVLNLSDKFTKEAEMAKRAKQENARRRALANKYFDDVPSIPNLAKGIYYWATSEPALFGEDETPSVNKGYAPVVGVGSQAISAVRNIPKAVTLAKQSLPGLAFLSAYLGGQDGETQEKYSQNIALSKPIYYDMAESNPTDSVSSNNNQKKADNGAADSNNSNTNNQNNDENQNKGFRDKLADRVSNIIRGKKAPKKNTGDSGSTKGHYIKKALWETSKSNYGEFYPLRNILRTAVYLSEGPGIAGYAFRAIPTYIDYAGDKFWDSYRGTSKKDSISNKKDTTIQKPEKQIITQPSDNNLDSIINVLNQAKQRQNSGQAKIYD